jgi:hypothetical protein
MRAVSARHGRFGVSEHTKNGTGNPSNGSRFQALCDVSRLRSSQRANGRCRRRRRGKLLQLRAYHPASTGVIPPITPRRMQNGPHAQLSTSVSLPLGVAPAPPLYSRSNLLSRIKPMGEGAGTIRRRKEILCRQCNGRGDFVLASAQTRSDALRPVGAPEVFGRCYWGRRHQVNDCIGYRLPTLADPIANGRVAPQAAIVERRLNIQLLSARRQPMHCNDRHYDFVSRPMAAPTKTNLVSARAA